MPELEIPSLEQVRSAQADGTLDSLLGSLSLEQKEAFVNQHQAELEYARQARREARPSVLETALPEIGAGYQQMGSGIYGAGNIAATLLGSPEAAKAYSETSEYAKTQAAKVPDYGGSWEQLDLTSPRDIGRYVASATLRNAPQMVGSAGLGAAAKLAGWGTRAAAFLGGGSLNLAQEAGEIGQSIEQETGRPLTRPQALGALGAGAVAAGLESISDVPVLESLFSKEAVSKVRGDWLKRTAQFLARTAAKGTEQAALEGITELGQTIVENIPPAWVKAGKSDDFWKSFYDEMGSDARVSDYLESMFKGAAAGGPMGAGAYGAGRLAKHLETKAEEFAQKNPVPPDTASITPRTEEPAAAEQVPYEKGPSRLRRPLASMPDLTGLVVPPAAQAPPADQAPPALAQLAWSPDAGLTEAPAADESWDVRTGLPRRAPEDTGLMQRTEAALARAQVTPVEPFEPSSRLSRLADVAARKQAEYESRLDRPLIQRTEAALAAAQVTPVEPFEPSSRLSRLADVAARKQAEYEREQTSRAVSRFGKISRAPKPTRVSDEIQKPPASPVPVVQGKPPQAPPEKPAEGRAAPEGSSDKEIKAAARRAADAALREEGGDYAKAIAALRSELDLDLTPVLRARYEGAIKLLEQEASKPAAAQSRDWEAYAEELRGDLDAFGPARDTGKMDYDLMDMADRFVEFAKADVSGKPLSKLVSEFAKGDDATKTQIKKLRESVKSLESKEAPKAPEKKSRLKKMEPGTSRVSVDPKTDELLGTNDRGEPVYWSSNAKTHYSISNGRVRTAPDVAGFSEAAIARLHELLTPDKPAAEAPQSRLKQTKSEGAPKPTEAAKPAAPSFKVRASVSERVGTRGKGFKEFKWRELAMKEFQTREEAQKFAEELLSGAKGDRFVRVSLNEMDGGRILAEQKFTAPGDKTRPHLPPDLMAMERTSPQEAPKPAPPSAKEKAKAFLKKGIKRTHEGEIGSLNLPNVKQQVINAALNAGIDLIDAGAKVVEVIQAIVAKLRELGAKFEEREVWRQLGPGLAEEMGEPVPEFKGEPVIKAPASKLSKQVVVPNSGLVSAKSIEDEGSADEWIDSHLNVKPSESQKIELEEQQESGLSKPGGKAMFGVHWRKVTAVPATGERLMQWWQKTIKGDTSGVPLITWEQGRSALALVFRLADGTYAITSVKEQAAYKKGTTPYVLDPNKADRVPKGETRTRIGGPSPFVQLEKIESSPTFKDAQLIGYTRVSDPYQLRASFSSVLGPREFQLVEGIASEITRNEMAQAAERAAVPTKVQFDEEGNPIETAITSEEDQPDFVPAEAVVWWDELLTQRRKLGRPLTDRELYGTLKQFSLNDPQSYKALLLSGLAAMTQNASADKVADLVKKISGDKQEQRDAKAQLDDIIVAATAEALEGAVASGEGSGKLLAGRAIRLADAGGAFDLGSGTGKAEGGTTDEVRYSALPGSASSSGEPSATGETESPTETQAPIPQLIHENNLRQSAALRQSSGQPGAASLVSSAAARQDAEAALAGIRLARNGPKLDSASIDDAYSQTEIGQTLLARARKEGLKLAFIRGLPDLNGVQFRDSILISTDGGRNDSSIEGAFEHELAHRKYQQGNAKLRELGRLAKLDSAAAKALQAFYLKSGLPKLEGASLREELVATFVGGTANYEGIPLAGAFAGEDGSNAGRARNLVQEYLGNRIATITRELGTNRQFAVAPSDEDAIAALDSSKRPLFGNARSLKDGTSVALRIDIPAFNRTGKYVVTVHQVAGGGGPGKVIGYDTVGRVLNPVFVVKPGVEKIRAGESAKFPVATVDGQFVSDRTIPDDIDQWTPVGMDPKEHAFFYDKRTDEAVVGGDEAISVGNTVFVRNPVYGNREDFRFSASQDAEYLAAVQAGDMDKAGRMAMDARYASLESKLGKDRPRTREALLALFQTRNFRHVFDVLKRGGWSRKEYSSGTMSIVSPKGIEFNVPSYSMRESDAFLAGFNSLPRYSPVTPVTYDSAGNVIPLSRRFDSGTGDIRYSLPDEEQQARFRQSVKEAELSRGAAAPAAEAAAKQSFENWLSTFKAPAEAIAQAASRSSDSLAEIRAQASLEAPEGQRLSEEQREQKRIAKRTLSQSFLRILSRLEKEVKDATDAAGPDLLSFEQAKADAALPPDQQRLSPSERNRIYTRAYEHVEKIWKTIAAFQNRFESRRGQIAEQLEQLRAEQTDLKAEDKLRTEVRKQLVTLYKEAGLELGQVGAQRQALYRQAKLNDATGHRILAFIGSQLDDIRAAAETRLADRQAAADAQMARTGQPRQTLALSESDWMAGVMEIAAFLGRQINPEDPSSPEQMLGGNVQRIAEVVRAWRQDEKLQTLVKEVRDALSAAGLKPINGLLPKKAAEKFEQLRQAYIQVLREAGDDPSKLRTALDKLISAQDKMSPEQVRRVLRVFARKESQLADELAALPIARQISNDLIRPGSTFANLAREIGNADPVGVDVKLSYVDDRTGEYVLNGLPGIDHASAHLLQVLNRLRQSSDPVNRAPDKATAAQWKELLNLQPDVPPWMVDLLDWPSDNTELTYTTDNPAVPGSNPRSVVNLLRTADKFARPMRVPIRPEQLKDSAALLERYLTSANSYIIGSKLEGQSVFGFYDPDVVRALENKVIPEIRLILGQRATKRVVRPDGTVVEVPEGLASGMDPKSGSTTFGLVMTADASILQLMPALAKNWAGFANVMESMSRGLPAPLRRFLYSALQPHTGVQADMEALATRFGPKLADAEQAALKSHGMTTSTNQVDLQEFYGSTIFDPLAATYQHADTGRRAQVGDMLITGHRVTKEDIALLELTHDLWDRAGQITKKHGLGIETIGPDGTVSYRAMWDLGPRMVPRSLLRALEQAKEFVLLKDASQMPDAVKQEEFLSQNPLLIHTYAAGAAHNEYKHNYAGYRMAMFRVVQKILNGGTAPENQALGSSGTDALTDLAVRVAEEFNQEQAALAGELEDGAPVPQPVSAVQVRQSLFKDIQGIFGRIEAEDQAWQKSVAELNKEGLQQDPDAKRHNSFAYRAKILGRQSELVTARGQLIAPPGWYDYAGFTPSALLRMGRISETPYLLRVLEYLGAMETALEQEKKTMDEALVPKATMEGGKLVSRIKDKGDPKRMAEAANRGEAWMNRKQLLEILTGLGQIRQDIDTRLQNMSEPPVGTRRYSTAGELAGRLFRNFKNMVLATVLANASVWFKQTFGNILLLSNRMNRTAANRGNPLRQAAILTRATKWQVQASASAALINEVVGQISNTPALSRLFGISQPITKHDRNLVQTMLPAWAKLVEEKVRRNDELVSLGIVKQEGTLNQLAELWQAWRSGGIPGKQPVLLDDTAIQRARRNSAMFAQTTMASVSLLAKRGLEVFDNANNLVGVKWAQYEFDNLHNRMLLAYDNDIPVEEVGLAFLTPDYSTEARAHLQDLLDRSQLDVGVVYERLAKTLNAARKHGPEALKQARLVTPLTRAELHELWRAGAGINKGTAWNRPSSMLTKNPLDSILWTLKGYPTYEFLDVFGSITNKMNNQSWARALPGILLASAELFALTTALGLGYNEVDKWWKRWVLNREMNRSTISDIVSGRVTDPKEIMAIVADGYAALTSLTGWAWYQITGRSKGERQSFDASRLILVLNLVVDTIGNMVQAWKQLDLKGVFESGKSIPERVEAAWLPFKQPMWNMLNRYVFPFNWNPDQLTRLIPESALQAMPDWLRATLPDNSGARAYANNVAIKKASAQRAGVNIKDVAGISKNYDAASPYYLAARNEAAAGNIEKALELAAKGRQQMTKVLGEREENGRIVGLSEKELDARHNQRIQAMLPNVGDKKPDADTLARIESTMTPEELELTRRVDGNLGAFIQAATGKTVSPITTRGSSGGGGGGSIAGISGGSGSSGDSAGAAAGSSLSGRSRLSGGSSLGRSRLSGGRLSGSRLSSSRRISSGRISSGRSAMKPKVMGRLGIRSSRLGGRKLKL